MDLIFNEWFWIQDKKFEVFRHMNLNFDAIHSEIRIAV